MGGSTDTPFSVTVGLGFFMPEREDGAREKCQRPREKGRSGRKAERGGVGLIAGAVVLHSLRGIQHVCVSSCASTRGLTIEYMLATSMHACPCPPCNLLAPLHRPRPSPGPSPHRTRRHRTRRHAFAPPSFLPPEVHSRQESMRSSRSPSHACVHRRCMPRRRHDRRSAGAGTRGSAPGVRGVGREA